MGASIVLGLREEMGGFVAFGRVNSFWFEEGRVSPAPKKVTVACQPEAVKEDEKRVHVFLHAGVFAKVETESL